MIKLIGVRTTKKIAAITIGGIILPKTSPSFIHERFKGVNIFEFSRPKTRNIKLNINDHILRSSE